MAFLSRRGMLECQDFLPKKVAICVISKEKVVFRELQFVEELRATAVLRNACFPARAA